MQLKTDEKFDVMSFERTAEIVKKDFLAYEIFKETSRPGELNTEIWPIVLTNGTLLIYN
jgi:hypothetical protein